MSQQRHLTAGDSPRGQVAAGAARRSAVSRRSFLSTIAGSFLASLSGCAFKRCDIAPDMPLPDLISHLNHNIDLISSWRSNNVAIKAHGAGMLTPKLTAKIAIERPRNFRLQASMPIGGSDLVDLGSNDERFWFWMRDEPAILTARHDCLEAAQRVLPLPFDPDWLIEALGVIPLDETEVELEKHPTNPKQCFFRRKRNGPDGTPVELVSTVDTCRGVIVAHSLSDKSGNIVALAQMRDHEVDAKSGVVLPHVVELSWPHAKQGLEITIGGLEVNPVTLAGEYFMMPEIANCPVHDIGGETQQASHVGRSKV